jgi:hypothetical protein
MTTPGLEVAPLRRAANPRVRPRSNSYLLITSAMTLTMALGFSFTYFGPIMRGGYPDVSPIVHVHGWTFFLWYLLLPLQAAMVRVRRVSLHRTLGLASLGLGAAMILVGLVVTVVQIDLARAPDGNPFWRLMGVPIFGVWILFTVFYVEAMRRRRTIEAHKRLIILASAAALSAATFRVLVQFAGFSPMKSMIGMLAVAIFPLAGMLVDRMQGRPAHPLYAWGTAAIVAMIAASFAIGATPAGELIVNGLGWVGRVVRPVYLVGS